MPDGMLNILKPPGCTSHDVVDEVRRITGTRKVGHTGTLDPAAAGVMILLLGTGTRLSEFLAAGRKTYRAEMTLGITTDTLDGEGTVVPGPARTEPAQITGEQVGDVLESLVGELEMAPPMYSAVRHEGRRLYQLAREGRTVAAKPRPVRVDRMELLCLEPGPPPRALVEIECSKGTYVRSLAAEVGERLGCGAHLSFLVRTAVGAHTLAESVTLAELEAKVAADGLEGALQPLADALGERPVVTVTAEGAQALAHGGRWPAPPEAGDAGLVCVLAPDGRLLCVAEVVMGPSGAELQPRRVLVGSDAL